MMSRFFALGVILALSGCGTAYVEGGGHKSEASAAEADGKAEKKQAAPADAKPGKEPAEKDKKEDGKDKEPAKDKEPEVHAHVEVRGAPAEKRSFAITVDGLGRTEPLPESVGAITAPVEGHVHKLLVKLGDAVTAGQPILELDTTIIRTALGEKLATRDSVKASLRLLESLPRAEERRAAELAVDQAKLGIERARALVDSLQTLFDKREVSQQQVTDARHALQQAVLQRQAAEAQLKLLTLGPRPEAVAEGQTKIAVAEQAVENSRATLGLHTLRAPIGGSIDSLTCHPGQTLTVGTAVGEIVDTRRLFVTVYFPTRSARNMRVGLLAQIEAPDGEKREAATSPSEEITGRVAFVGRVADAQTGSFPTRILVENSSGRLRIGQVVKATVTLRKEEPTIAVPEAAIFDQGEGPLLTVVRDGKIAILHPEVGPAVAGFVSVRKTDLREGETVAVEGAYAVPEGTTATVEPAHAETAASPTTGTPATGSPATGSPIGAKPAPASKEKEHE